MKNKFECLLVQLGSTEKAWLYQKLAFFIPIILLLCLKYKKYIEQEKLYNYVSLMYQQLLKVPKKKKKTIEGKE